MKNSKSAYAYNLKFLNYFFSHDLSHLRDKRRFLFPFVIYEFVIEIILLPIIFIFIGISTTFVIDIFINNSFADTPKFCEKNISIYEGCFSKHSIKFIIIISLMSIAVRLPWQIPMAIFLRCLKKNIKQNFYIGTALPIIKSYLICYHIFVLPIVMLFFIYKDDGEYKWLFLYFFIKLLSVPSLFAALLAPYLVYKISGKTLGQRILGN